MRRPEGSDRRGAEPGSVRLLLAVARRLLRRYPDDFRARFADAAYRHTADVARAAHRRGGAFAVLALGPRLLWDLRPRSLQPRTRSARSPSAAPPARSERTAPMFDTLLQDLAFARRALARRPAASALALLILAVGIGSSVAMFSVVDAVVLRPLPYPDSDRIASIYLSIPEWRDNPSLGPIWQRTRWEYQEFEDWRARQTSFERAALMGAASATMTRPGAANAERVRVGLAGVGLFEVVGQTPRLGRLFSDGDRADPAVALVSYPFWQSQLGGSEDAVGAGITLDGTAHFIVGVLPAGFELSPVEADVWIPIFDNRPNGYFPGNTGDSSHVYSAIGLLEEGVEPERAAQEITRLLPEIGGEEHFTRHSGNVVPRLFDETRNVRGPMTLLMGAVFVLLVVACANVATVLLGQAIDRRQEIAVRSAIGAGHGRIVRQLLTESAVLGVVAGVVGLLLARAGIAGLAWLTPSNLPRVDTVGLDLRAAGFAIGVSLLAGLLFGIAPALSLGRTELARAMGAVRSGTRAGSRLQAGMVIAEIALATVLLVGAGLLVRSFVRLNAVDPGFDPEGVVMLQLSMDARAFRTAEGDFDDGAMRARMAQISDAVRALPGVEDVAVAQAPPFTYFGANNDVYPEGYVPQEGEFVLAHRRFVTPGYFEIVGARLLEGRFLEPADNRPEAASVVVVTEGLARRFWPGESALGKRLGWWSQESTIVGVVGDVLDMSLAAEPEIQFFAPPAPFGQAGGFLMIGTASADDAMVTALRNTVQLEAPAFPIARLYRLEDRVALSLDQARFRTRLIVLFALVAAVLSVFGLYGVTSRAVAGRARELGVRVALGADRGSVIGLVLRDGVRLAALGALVGVAVALAGTRLLESFLYEVEPNDPVTLVAIVALVTTMALLASLVPSLRASRVDPVRVLRTDV